MLKNFNTIHLEIGSQSFFDPELVQHADCDTLVKRKGYSHGKRMI